jgi:hypothetical protein
LFRNAASKPNPKPSQTKQKQKIVESSLSQRSTAAGGEPVKVEENQPQFQIKVNDASLCCTDTA